MRQPAWPQQFGSTLLARAVLFDSCLLDDIGPMSRSLLFTVREDMILIDESEKF